MGNLFTPLRFHSFCLLFIGQLISSVGDVFYEVALPWFILTSGGTAQDLGFVVGAYGLPRIGTVLLGGWLADHLGPRRVMVIADAARALLVGVLAFLVLNGNVVLWQLCLIAVPLGAFAGVFSPAYLTLTPNLLPEEALQAGNSLNSASLQLATLIGPGIAGLVVTRLRSAPAFGVDALSFVVSAATLGIIRVQEPSSKESRASGIIADDRGTSFSDVPTADGQTSPGSFWRLLQSSPFLQALLLFPLLGNLTGGALGAVALPALVRGPLGAGAEAYGLLLVGSGAGALLGAVAAARLSHVSQRGKTMLLCFLAQQILISLVPLGGSHTGITGVILLEIGSGFVNAVGNAFFLTILQQGAPRALLGRVMGALLFTNYAFYPLSVVLGGVVVARFGPAIVFPASAILVLVAIIAGWMLPAIRQA